MTHVRLLDLHAVGSEFASPRLKGSLMAAPPLDDFIAAAAKALDLPFDPAWQPAIKANLEVSLKLGNMVAEFPLPDTAEPAPIYKA
jgi:hypothetical protein